MHNSFYIFLNSPFVVNFSNLKVSPINKSSCANSLQDILNIKRSIGHLLQPDQFNPETMFLFCSY